MSTNEWQIEFVRNLFWDSAVDLSVKPKRLFLQRAEGKRSIVNSDSILTALKEKYGFTFVELESYSVAEAAMLFNSAEIVVGPHGAGFTNIVFGSPDLKVGELFSQHVSSEFYLLATKIGQKHAFVSEFDTHGRRWNECDLDYSINGECINAEKIQLSENTLKFVEKVT